MDFFEEMQKAVDIVNTSPHPENKIAAALAGTGPDKKPFSLTRTNYWPPLIEKHLGGARIGNSSGTIHAETACILAAPRSEDASLFITDPFCPNCAKNVAEAGIRAIYIDHKGFNKDFAARRGHHFSSMSMQICEKAGISVYELRRKERELTPILEVPPSYRPVEENPVHVELLGSADEGTFCELVADRRQENRGHKFAVALARDHQNRVRGLSARAHPVIGYSTADDLDELEHPPESKYSFMLEPLNRLLMNAARNGLRLIDGLVFSSGVPTAREQVNFAGANLSQIYIGDPLKARDENAFAAMKVLSRHEIVSFRKF